MVMTIQPLSLALEVGSRTPATTPQPRRMRRNVPRASEAKIWVRVADMCGSLSARRCAGLFGTARSGVLVVGGRGARLHGN